MCQVEVKVCDCIAAVISEIIGCRWTPFFLYFPIVTNNVVCEGHGSIYLCMQRVKSTIFNDVPVPAILWALLLWQVSVLLVSQSRLSSASPHHHWHLNGFDILSFFKIKNTGLITFVELLFCSGSCQNMTGYKDMLFGNCQFLLHSDVNTGWRIKGGPFHFVAYG